MPYMVKIQAFTKGFYTYQFLDRIIKGKGGAPMDKVMLFIAICNCVINAVGLALKIFEIRQEKSRS